MEELLKFRVNSIDNNGWDFDYEFLKEIKRRTADDQLEQIELEEVNAVLLSLINYFAANNL